MRMVFDSPGADGRAALEERFEREIATPFEMEHSFSESGRAKRVAVMVSREDHCLSDLLWRWRNGHLGGEIVTVVSNHDDLRGEVEAVGLPFHHLPISAETREEAEEQALDLIAEVDLLVLARYMQILSPAFLAALEAVGIRAINIHHSFLPAFVGADPYARAHERGVKLIGATAHYVTADLDAGPIIDQDVVRVGHADEVPDLVRIGRDVERLVLARAVTVHLEDRVLLDGGRTVVF
jgi:formyltetrahydrofolate deformylase